jgi:hypothetical protein
LRLLIAAVGKSPRSINTTGINRNSQEAAENDGVEQFEEDEDFTTLWREESLDSDPNAGQLREKRPASVDQRLWRTHDRLDVKFFHRTARDFSCQHNFWRRHYPEVHGH